MQAVPKTLVLLAALWSAAAVAVEEGDAAPAWRAETFDGRAVEFPELIGGKPTVVVFWATWCNYCRAFMPHLARIQADYGERVNILAINAKEEAGADPQGYVDALGFPVIAVREGDAVAAAYGVEYIPGLMVVDAEGAVAYRREWTELPAGETVARFWSRQVRRALDRLLER